MSEQSQEDLHKEVCKLTDRIFALRHAKGYGKQAELQRVRKQREALQAKLTRPTLVWVNPASLQPIS